MKNQFLTSLFLIGLVAILLVSNCKKDEKNMTEDLADETPQELLDQFDQLEIADQITTKDILLPNGWNLEDFMIENDSAFFYDWSRNDPYDGLTPSQAYTLMLGKMATVAMSLTNRQNFQYPNNIPPLNGLAYSWGSKNYKMLQLPPGSDAVCTHNIYGLDCSGFIFQLFKNALVSFPEGNANNQRKTTTLEKNISSRISALKNIKFEDKGSINQSDFKNGDIIYWSDTSGNVFHIGFVLFAGVKKTLFHCIGRNKVGLCDENLSIKNGPVRHFLDPANPLPLATYKYAIVRAAVEDDCTGCANNFCNQPPSQSLIEQSLANFNFGPGKANKAEAKRILKHLCTDIVHEYNYGNGDFFVCGKMPSGYEITLWSPTYLKDDRYGVRFGLLTGNHSYFGSNSTYFEIVK